MTREEAKNILARLAGGVTFPTWEQIRNAARLALNLFDKRPLPSNLDEAAEKYANRGISSNSDPYEETIAYQADRDAFKAGAEWMAQQGVKAHCIESSNPVSENPNQRLRLITLLYEENEDTPYVVAGDDIEVILRKK